jgi:hypothetical protein
VDLIDKEQWSSLSADVKVDSVTRLCAMNLLLHGIGSEAYGQLSEDLPVVTKDALAGRGADVLCSHLPNTLFPSTSSALRVRVPRSFCASRLRPRHCLRCRCDPLRSAVDFKALNRSRRKRPTDPLSPDSPGC